METNTILCKICGSEKNIVLFKKDGFPILKCNDCKIVFTNVPASLDLNTIYDNSYFQGGQQYGYGNYAASEKVLRKGFSKTVSLIRNFTHNRRGLQLLELGSAYGYFIDEAQAFFNCTGLEISRAAAAVSKKSGHRIYTREYDEKIAGEIGNIDIVAMFDVIEIQRSPKGDRRLGRLGLRRTWLWLDAVDQRCRDRKSVV